MAVTILIQVTKLSLTATATTHHYYSPKDTSPLLPSLLANSVFIKS